MYIDTVSLYPDINRKVLAYYYSKDGSRSKLAATTHSRDKLKIVVIRKKKDILEVIIKSKTNTHKRSRDPSVSINPSKSSLNKLNHIISVS